MWRRSALYISFSAVARSGRCPTRVNRVIPEPPPFLDCRIQYLFRGSVSHTVLYCTVCSPDTSESANPAVQVTIPDPSFVRVSDQKKIVWERTVNLNLNVLTARNNPNSKICQSKYLTYGMVYAHLDYRDTTVFSP